MRDTLRGWVQFAADIAEETGRRTVHTARDLLDRGGVDVQALQRALTEQVPASARSLQSVADDVVAAGRTGRDLVVGLVRSEAERTVQLAGWVGDQVVKTGVLLELLERKLREVEESGAAAEEEAPPQARAEQLFGAGWQQETGAERPVRPVRIPVADEPVDGPEAAAESAAEAAAEAAPAKKAPVPRKTTGPGGAAGRRGAPTAGQVAEGRAAARTAPARRAAAEEAPARKTPVPRKTAAGKPTSEKVGPGQEAPEQVSGVKAEQVAAAKRTAAKKAAVKKAATKKAAVTRTAIEKTTTAGTTAKKTAKTTAKKTSAARRRAAGGE
ncbi:hypothetical protein ACIQGZ_22500 [Streptomyces sp. NPDC092296]|uniref:hypothetical protein n=1 Tax=Streptomyces sp. NPDC092296 TaxID=3366012 RepID=UPI00382226E4